MSHPADMPKKQLAKKSKPIKKQKCPPGYYWKDGGCHLDDRSKKQKEIQDSFKK
jgi:hypothetical protein